MNKGAKMWSLSTEYCSYPSIKAADITALLNGNSAWAWLG